MNPLGSLAGRGARLALGAAALPLALGQAAAEEVRGATRRVAGLVPDVPVLPAPDWPEPVSSAAEAAERVRALPIASVRRPTLALARAGLPDWALMLLSATPELALLGFRYPPAFRHRVLRGADGEPIAALTALEAERGRPAVILAHGAATTKHFDYVRRAALRLHALGFDIVAIDLRSFGMTALASEAPTSLGYEEGRDILAIADWLTARGAASVGVLGFSLGGSAALCAAHEASVRGHGLEGGVLALSAPTDLADALEHVTRRPALGDPLFGTWLTFRLTTTARLRQLGATTEAVSPRDAIERISVPYYGLDLEELCGRASAARFAHELRIPTLLVHAADDRIVPVEHALALEERAHGNEHVHVVIRETGGHAALDAVDAAWTAEVERLWLGSLARRAS